MNNKNTKNEIYYQCYQDSKTFQTEKNYIDHFNKYYPNDYPFYCDIWIEDFTLILP